MQMGPGPIVLQPGRARHPPRDCNVVSNWAVLLRGTLVHHQPTSSITSSACPVCSQHTGFAYWEDDRLAMNNEPCEPVVPSSSLDAPETSVSADVARVVKAVGGTLARTNPVDTPYDFDDAPDMSALTLSQSFKHSGWHLRRLQVWKAFHYMGVKRHRRAAFENCGNECYVLRSRTNPQDVRLASNACRDRFCLPCAQRRSREIAVNIQRLVQPGRVRFVTLTLKHNASSLKTSLDRLYGCFRKLRQSKLWKATQTGGAAFLEVKRSKDGNHWHPHFHVITQGKFIDQTQLRKEWHRITTDSFIVDVRAVRDANTVTQYVTKYASKPFDPSLWSNNDVLCEAISAMRGVRMVLAFGDYKQCLVRTKPSADDWETLGTLESVAWAAIRGDTAQLEALNYALGLNTLPVMNAISARNRPPPSVEPDRVKVTQLWFDYINKPGTIY